MGTCIYSLENSQDVPKMMSEFDGITYEVDITWAQAIGDKDVD
jgi:hypothetical protein